MQKWRGNLPETNGIQLPYDRHKLSTVTKSSSITITMKRNGGFAAIIE